MKRNNEHHASYYPGRVRYVAVLVHHIHEPLPEYCRAENGKTSFYRTSSTFFFLNKIYMETKSEKRVCVCYGIMCTIHQNTKKSNITETDVRDSIPQLFTSDRSYIVCYTCKYKGGSTSAYCSTSKGKAAVTQPKKEQPRHSGKKQEFSVTQQNPHKNTNCSVGRDFITQTPPKVLLRKPHEKTNMVTKSNNNKNMAGVG